MKQFLLAWAILCIASTFLFAQRPIVRTESALTLGKGTVQAGAGMEYFRKNIAPPPQFPQSVLRFFVLGWHYGVAENVDSDLDWSGGMLAAFSGGQRRFDWGDLTVSTKIAFVQDSADIPAIGIRTAVKLPNTTYFHSRLGSNQMDFHSFLLISKRFSHVETRFNFRFSIVGDPEILGVQDDVYAIQAALIGALTEELKFFFELEGFSGYDDHNSKLLTRYGFLCNLGEYEYGLYSSLRAAGDNRDFGNAFEGGENWSIGLTVIRAFSFNIF